MRSSRRHSHFVCAARGADVTSVARGAACPFCRRQISRPECQRVIGGRRGGDAKPNQCLALRLDHLAISLCQANGGVKLAARCPRRRDLFDRMHEKRSIIFQSASNVTHCRQFDLLRFVFFSPFRRSQDQVESDLKNFSFLRQLGPDELKLFSVHSERETSFTPIAFIMRWINLLLILILEFFPHHPSSLLLLFICFSFRGSDPDWKRHLPHHCAGHQ